MKPHVLMVEDDTATGEVLTEVLADAGYTVTLAGSGNEALELLAQQPFTVVVSDIRMPSVDGIDVLHAARQSPSQPEVILLTGYGALETSLAALREGAFDYLLKPCEPEILLQRVADAVNTYSSRQRRANAIKHLVNEFDHLTVGASESEDPPNDETTVSIFEQEQPDQPLDVGELRIGSAHHLATFKDEPLHLTPTEHALLRCMAEKPGKVFQYRELVYRMHGYDVPNIEAKVLLKTHIRNIRHKIGPDYLVNIRSTGYKLVSPEESRESGTEEESDDDEDC
jgi:DNA-binding response OmpR family regulator